MRKDPLSRIGFWTQTLRNRCKSAKLPRMIEEPARNIRAIHDLERAVHVWEMLRDTAQRAINETTACSEKEGDSGENSPTVVKARAYIDACNASILATKTRIDELVRGIK